MTQKKNLNPQPPGRYGISDAEAQQFTHQVPIRPWSAGPSVSVLDGLVSHEWPIDSPGHQASPQCPCEPFYAGMAGRLQVWHHENPVVGVRARRGALPIAYWMDHSTRLHTSWGLSMRQAKNRAARWGQQHTGEES